MRYAVKNKHEIMRAVVEYREACADVEPRWRAFQRHEGEIPPESQKRREARQAYLDAQERVKRAREWLLESARDGARE